MSHAWHRFLTFYKTLTFWYVLLVFSKVHNPLRLPRETASERPKVVRACGAFHILTSTCASRHNGVHFFDISTSKSGPELVCFVHFDLEMCFAPQRRALFRHLNFQKWSEPLVFLTFWLGNVLRTTTACNFSSLIWPAVSAPAALASLLFDPLEPQIIGKTQCFATFLPFRAPDLLSSDSFSSLIFSLLPFSLLLFSSPFFCSTSAFHLSVHIVGSLTSKLPSIILYIYIIYIYIRFISERNSTRLTRLDRLDTIIYTGNNWSKVLQLIQHIQHSNSTRHPEKQSIPAPWDGYLEFGWIRHHLGSGLGFNVRDVPVTFGKACYVEEGANMKELQQFSTSYPAAPPAMNWLWS